MTYQFDNNGMLKVLTAEELADADANSAVIELDCGTLQDGRPYWAYIAVKPSKYKEFKRLTSQHQPLVLTDYGKILKYGFDKEVPASAKEEMQREYNCADNFVAIMAGDIKKAQTKHEANRISDIVAMLAKQKPK